MSVGAGFRARAGTLTLLYMVSDADRSVLRTMLAEAATGTSVQDFEPLPGGQEEYLAHIVNDPYLLEPADPDLGPGTPIGPDTLIQPTPAGREFVAVAAVLEAWTSARPGGPPATEQESGEAVATLLAGWSATVAHALAGGPLTVEEARERVPTLDDELVETYIVEMAGTGLLEASGEAGGEARYGPTEWTRRAIAPLAAAARMEHRHPAGDTAPIAVADVEAAFQLALPLVRVPGRVSGSCELVVELEDEVVGAPAAVTAHVEDGRVVEVVPGLSDGAEARATAPAPEWIDAVIDGARVVEMSGELPLPRYLVDGLHEALFPA